MKRRSPPPRLQLLEGTVVELSPGGDGVLLLDVEAERSAPSERRAVFVPGVALGEKVRVNADLSKRPARGRLLDVLTASASRVTPRCEHVERCGGCDFMHLTEDAQAEAHASIVRRLVANALRRDDVVVRAHAHAPGASWHYRARSRLHVDAYRGKITIGMYGKGSHVPVAVDACLVLAPPIERARLFLPSLFVGAEGRGEVQLALGAPSGSDDDRRAVMDLRWTGKLPSEIFARLERAIGQRSLAGARVFDGPVTTPATIGDPTPWIVAADGRALRLAPGGFSQATEAGNAILARRAADLAGELVADPAATVVELHAGAGNLTVLLATNHAVIAVEKGREACEAARENLRARGLTAKVVDADADTFPLPKCKLVVLDPPRTGAREVCTALARKPVPAVLYVSCDPATLARDLGILAGAGYALRTLETFEMFPQTSHVETVAVLVHERGKRTSTSS